MTLTVLYRSPYSSVTVSSIHARGLLIYQFTPEAFLINKKTNQIKYIGFALNHKEQKDHINKQQIAYLAPEQTGKTDQAIDQTSNLYSLGILLYQLSCQQLPFQFDEWEKIANAHLKQTPIPPREINPNLTLHINKIILALLNKKKDERYQSSNGLIQDLHNKTVTSMQLNTNFTFPHKLIGMNTLLREMTSAHKKVLAGEKQSLSLHGAAGSGKTSLVSAFTQTLNPHQHFIIHIKFTQHQEKLSYVTLLNELNNSLTKNGYINSHLIQALNATAPDSTNALAQALPALGKHLNLKPSPNNKSLLTKQNAFKQAFFELIRQLTNSCKSVIIHLDDCQWATDSTFDLLSVLKLTKCMLIYSYRTHHSNDLTDFLTTQQPQQCQLEPLSTKQVIQFCQLTLHTKTPAIKTLAKALKNKTGGNPYYLRLFLTSLINKKLIYINYNHNWEWDIKKINDEYCTDNVADKLIEHINELQLSRAAIALLKALALISVKTPTGLIHLLNEDFNKKTLTELYNAKLLQVNRNKEVSFSHDRVQEAALNLFQSNDEIKKTAWQQGVTLHKKQPSNISIITNLINQGPEESKREQTEIVIHYNFKASELAKKRFEYKTAFDHSRVAIQYLNSAELEQDLTIYLNHIELMFNHTDKDELKRFIHRALNIAQSMQAKTAIYELVASQYVLLNEFQQSIELLLQALGALGLTIKQDEAADKKIISSVIQTLSNNTSLANQDNSKPNTDTSCKITLLNMLMSPAFLVNQDLLDLTAAIAIQLAIEHQCTSHITFLIACFAITLVKPKFNEISLANQLAQDALQLSEKTGDTTLICRTGMALVSSVLHMANPLANSISIIKKSIAAGEQAYDLQHVGYCYYLYILALYSTGTTLKQILEQLENYLNLAKQYNHSTAIDMLRVCRQHFQILQNAQTEEFDLITLTPMAQCSLHILAATRAILTNNNGSAKQHLNQAKPLLNNISGFMLSIEHRFLLLITELATGDFQHYETEKKYFSHLSRHSPANFSHMLFFIKAEYQRHLNKKWCTIEYVDKAIDAAQQSNFKHYVIIYQQKAAAFLLRHKPAFAKPYLEQLIQQSEVWGASQIYQHIAQQHDQHFGTCRQDEVKLKSNINLHAIANMLTKLSNGQSLADFLQQCLTLLLENTAANKVAILINDPFMFAEIDPEKSGLTARNSETALAQHQQQKALNDTLEKAESYFPKNNDKSQAFIPIINQSKQLTLGVLYLENTLLPNIFNNNSDSINIIANQIATSIEIIQLYQTLAVSKQKLVDLIRRICHDIRNPLSGILLSLSALNECQQQLATIDLNNKQTELLTNIQLCADYIKRVCDGFLTLSKLESGDENLQLCSFNLIELINSSVQLLQAQIQTKKNQTRNRHT